MIRIKRAYEDPAPDDGRRILVDRLWPRGLKKEEAAIEIWMKAIAPSTELRKWYGHDPVRWDEFQRRYRKELEEHGEAIEKLLAICRSSDVTLLYSAKTHDLNNAVALREYLMERLG